MMPGVLLPPLLVGCLAGTLVERHPALSSVQRLVLGGVSSLLALILQLLLSGYAPLMIAQVVVVTWWSYALLSAGLFWLTSLLFPWREW